MVDAVRPGSTARTLRDPVAGPFARRAGLAAMRERMTVQRNSNEPRSTGYTRLQLTSAFVSPGLGRASGPSRASARDSSSP